MGKGDGAEKQIGASRRRPVGIVIINPVSAPALFFLLAGIPPHVAVVVVNPYYSQIPGHLKAVVVQLKHLLIGHKGL